MDTNTVEAQAPTITLPNRSALWKDSNTATEYTEFIEAGTYTVAEIKDGFTLISGFGWVNCVPN
jgi:hypothetical protein